MMLTVTNLHKAFGDHKVLEAVNFSLEKDRIYALLGPSGSGKSLLFHILSQLIKPDLGSISFKEGHQCSYMQQKDLLLPHLNIIDNIALPLLLAHHSKDSAYEQIEPLLKKFRLDSYSTSFPQELSGGMRQRIALLRATINRPSILLMDEPFSALDTLTAIKMHHFIKQIQQDRASTILFITHNINEALDLAAELFCMSGSPSRINYHIKVNPNQREYQYQQLFRLLSQATDEC